MSRKDKKESCQKKSDNEVLNEENASQAHHCGCDAHAEACECGDSCQCGDDCQCEKETSCAEECQAENAPEQDKLSEIMKLLDLAKAESDKNRDLYLRSVADLDTYRRKVQREKQELAKFALAPLIEELLPSLDHLEMAIDAAKKSNEAPALTSGVEMVLSQVTKVLENFGLTRVDALGKPFDPTLEDCVSQVPSEDVAEGNVISVMRNGYSLNGRLLRPASVVVSGGKAEK